MVTIGLKLTEFSKDAEIRHAVKTEKICKKLAELQKQWLYYLDAEILHPV